MGRYHRPFFRGSDIVMKHRVARLPVSVGVLSQDWVARYVVGVGFSPRRGGISVAAGWRTPTRR
jgi:hypothetical protein